MVENLHARAEWRLEEPRIRGGHTAPLQGMQVGSEVAGRIQLVCLAQPLRFWRDYASAEFTLPENLDPPPGCIVVETDEADQGLSGAVFTQVWHGDPGDQILAMADSHDLALARKPVGVMQALPGEQSQRLSIRELSRNKSPPTPANRAIRSPRPRPVASSPWARQADRSSSRRSRPRMLGKSSGESARTATWASFVPVPGTGIPKFRPRPSNRPLIRTERTLRFDTSATAGKDVTRRSARREWESGGESGSSGS